MANKRQVGARAGWVCAAALLAAPAGAAPVTMLIDAGSSGTTTTKAASPDDPNNYWNNLTDTIGQSNTGTIASLVDTANNSTGVGLAMIARFNAANTNGTTTSTKYPTDATRDSLYGNTESFNGLSNIFPSFKLTGLTVGQTYDLTFYASRTGVADNRETQYTLVGDTTQTAVLNAANNVDNTVTVSGLAPSAAGEITISMAPGANNTNTANHFTYLGVLSVTGEVAVPEPGTFGLILGGAGIALGRRRRGR